MDESDAMFLVLCLLGCVGFSFAGLIFIGTDGWPISVWFFAIAAFWGWMASRVMREARP